MNWLNISGKTLDSPEFLGSETIDRGTWLCLQRYCIGQENSGVIPNCRSWPDRMWLQLVRITKDEAMRECELWSWDGESLVVWGYGIEKQEEVRQRREQARANGSKGGRPPKGRNETGDGSGVETHGEPTSVIRKTHGEPTLVISETHAEPTLVVPETHGKPTLVIRETHGKPTLVIRETHGEPTSVISETHAEPTLVVPETHGKPTLVSRRADSLDFAGDFPDSTSASPTADRNPASVIPETHGEPTSVILETNGKPTWVTGKNLEEKRIEEKRMEESERASAPGVRASARAREPAYAESMPTEPATLMLDLERQVQAMRPGWNTLFSYAEQQAMVANARCLCSVQGDDWKTIRDYLAARLPEGMPAYQPRSRLKFIENLPDVLGHAAEWARKHRTAAKPNPGGIWK